MKRDGFRPEFGIGLVLAVFLLLGDVVRAEIPELLRRPGHMEFATDPVEVVGAQGPVQLTTPGAVVLVGSVRSTQVNVNAEGLNIVGDAANEPSMAVDPFDPNRIAIGWRQFDTIESDFRKGGFAFSEDGGRSWTFPGTLEENIFASDPVLSFDLEGNFFYYSLQPNRGPGQWACYLYKSTDGGKSWPADEYGFGGDKAWIEVDRTGGIGRGNIYIAWSRFANCCGNRTFTRSVDGGVTFMEPINVPFEPFFGTLTVDPDGRLFVVGATDLFGSFVVSRSSNAGDPNVVPKFDQSRFLALGGSLPRSFGPNPGGLLGQVWIDADHSDGPTRGNIYILSSITPFAGDDPADVMFIRSEDGGSTWSAPVRVNDDVPGNGAFQWFGTMSVAPNGRIDVFWNDTRHDPTVTFSEVYYSSSVDGGKTWSTNQVVSPPFNHFLGYPIQNKIGDYWQARSDDRGVNLAYSATFNGEQDVYHLRVERTIGDGDLDGDTDLSDYGEFVACSQEFGTFCDRFDLDSDEDVDLVDYGGFQDGFSGACGVTIVEEPEDSAVCPGDDVWFSVGVVGEALTYRWHRNGVVIPGADGSTLTLEDVTHDQAGLYHVTVVGACSQAMSRSAALDVPLSATVTSQPVGGSICEGDGFSLSVQATGVAPLSYQWRLDGEDVPGATDGDLFVGRTDGDDFGDYSCLITDGCGQVTESEVVEVERRDVEIHTGPQGGTACVGAPFILFVSAHRAVGFQWFREGVEISGATQFFYSVEGASLADAGDYQVVVSNECNDETSEVAEVIVNECP